MKQQSIRHIFNRSILPLASIVMAIQSNSLLLAQTTTRISVSSSGEQGNGSCADPYITGDGRFVVFESDATNLVPNDTNGIRDIFVHDRLTGQTTRVNVSSTGEQANNFGAQGGPVISDDGRFVVFPTTATNLVPDDTNGEADVFLHDRQSSQTTRVNVSSKGEQANSRSSFPTISADGRSIGFYSNASNLVPDDTNGNVDAFVHDRVTGETTLVSVSSDGRLYGAYNPTFESGSPGPALSADGLYVTFMSLENFVRDDTNLNVDAYVKDRQTGENTRASHNSIGEGCPFDSRNPSISDDGRFVAFISRCPYVEEDETGFYDHYLHDRLTGETSMVTVSSSGEQANSETSLVIQISANGRFIVYPHRATNLVPGDTNEFADIFVHDRVSHHTKRVSLAWNHAQGNDASSISTISADGRFVAFTSTATNLIAEDTNEQTDVFVRDRGVCSFADVNGDSAIGVPDLLSIINHWGACAIPYPDCINDVAPEGGDGNVGVPDLLMIIDNWGPCP